MSRHRGFHMLRPIDERGKLRPKFVVAYLAFTSFLLILAAIQTAYVGSAAWLTWALAGFFVFLVGMMSTTYGMSRLQEKALTEGREFAPLGGRWIGPMLLAGVALSILGGLGVGFSALAADCVAKVTCEPVPPLAPPTFLVALALGAALLIGAFILATRRPRRGGGSR